MIQTQQHMATLLATMIQTQQNMDRSQQDMVVRLANITARAENGLIRTVNESLRPIQAFGNDPRKLGSPRWHVGREFPKRVIDFWEMGRCARGEWQPEELEGWSKARRIYLPV